MQHQLEMFTAERIVRRNPRHELRPRWTRSRKWSHSKRLYAEIGLGTGARWLGVDRGVEPPRAVYLVFLVVCLDDS